MDPLLRPAVDPNLIALFARRLERRAHAAVQSKVLDLARLGQPVVVMDTLRSARRKRLPGWRWW